MNAAHFRRIALSLDGVEEKSHMGSPDFRVGGRIFATLADLDDGFGNVMLSPAQQVDYVDARPSVFVPVRGAWGRKGATHIRLARTNKTELTGALRTAWELRLQKNSKPRKRQT